MKKVKKLSKGVIVPTIIIGFILFVFVGKNIISNIFDEYPVLKKDEAVFETVTSVDKYKGTTLIKTKSGKSYGVRAFKPSNHYSILYDHIEVGDSLAHEPGSRLIYLYKKENGGK